MRLLRWSVFLLLRILGGVNASELLQGADLRVGFALSTNPTVVDPQPRDFSLGQLDLDFFVQVANQELKVPIMPLHLLGKKSWNVYNIDNIEKVKRDEAVAKALEEAEEQRMQEIDAERRMQILRGETPTPLPDVEEKDEGTRESRPHEPGRERKRRKKAGENDTDFEMRIAHEQVTRNTEKQMVLRKTTDAPLIDRSGHIDLFPQEAPKKGTYKNEEAEKEADKKKKEYEDQYTMKFSNAAGFKQGLESPWYSKPDPLEPEATKKDVWGNDDPRRKDRQAARIVSNDPLAMMKQGAAKVRQVEKEKKRWREEKEKELNLLLQEEHRSKRKRRHNDEDDIDEPRLERSEVSRRRQDDHDKDRRHRHRNRESSRGSYRDEDNEDRHKQKHKHKHRHRRE